MKNLSLLIAALFVFTITGQANAESLQNPMGQKSVTLFYHNGKVENQKVMNRVNLTCTDKSLELSKCEEFVLTNDYMEKNGSITATYNLGSFEKAKLEELFTHIIKSYNSKYNPGPLVVVTGAGAVVGFAVGKMTGAIALGVLGFFVDLIKSPVSLAYTLVSKIHRHDQKRKFKKRLNALLKNKKYKPTNIIGDFQFYSLLNHSVEWALANRI